MSLTAHMNHSCVITRDSGSIEDKFGGPGTPDISTVYDGICRLVEKQQRVYSSDNAQLVTVTIYKLFLPSNAAVIDRDLVASITVDGEVLENAFVVKQKLTRRTNATAFLSVDLEKVT